MAACCLLLAPAAADAASLGGRALAIGARGSDVAELQRALVALGHDLAVDGQFGRGTRRAVRRYERGRGAAVDGRVTRREGRRIARAAARVRAGDEPAPAGGVSPGDLAPPPTAEPAAPSGAGYVFPVSGTYSLGSDVSRFGADRGSHRHQGHDVFAAEGTPVVSVTAGVVHWRAYQASGAGYYLVVRGSDGFDYAYMHLRDPALPAVGGPVAAGERIGYVGATGRAQGAHLHFEIWDGPWHAGGEPVDPLPYLTRWAA